MYPNLNIIPLGSGENGKEPSCGKGIHKEENFEKYSQLTRTKKAPMYAILTG